MTYEQVLLKAQALTNDEDNKHAIFWLFQEFFNIDHTTYFMNLNEQLTNEKIAEFDLLVGKFLKENIPVQYLMGYSYFYNRKFHVNNYTLIPRSETESLVSKTINLIKTHFNNQNEIKVLDLATGSGCIGITIKLETNFDVTISDISKEALKIAGKNVKTYDAKINIIESDWFENINTKFDVIIANPPYIPTNQYVPKLVLKEPHNALYSGILGIDSYEAILKDAKKHLNDKAIIAFEHGYDQKHILFELAKKHFKDAKIIQETDLASKDRYTFIIIGE